MLWALMLARAFCSIVGQSNEEIYRAALPPLVIALKAWYKRHAKLYPDLQITTINDVTPAMLGTPGAMVIKTKAVETKYFFYFTLEAWSDHQGILDARVYKQYSIAANALKKYIVILAGNPVTIPKPQRKDQCVLFYL